MPSSMAFLAFAERRPTPVSKSAASMARRCFATASLKFLFGKIDDIPPLLVKTLLFLEITISIIGDALAKPR